MPGALGALGTVGTLFALEVPKLPPLSEDPSVIAVVDAVRVVLLIAGLTLAALTVRQAVTIPREIAPAQFVEKFRWRAAAIFVALLYVSLSAYDRIGTPVSVQFVMAVLFVALAAISTHKVAALPRPASAGEQRILDYLTHHDNGGTGRAP